MGDPKRLRKKYETPRHPWIESEIKENKELRRDYGLRNTREILKAESFLKKYKNIAKRLIAQQTVQGEKEKAQILEKLQRLGLLPAGATLDNILGLNTRSVLNRRLQSVLFNKNLARTMKQARQFIVHRHVSIAGKEITAPAYLVSLEEEAHLNFKVNSQLADESHPERAVEKPQESQAPAKENSNKSEKEEAQTAAQEQGNVAQETQEKVQEDKNAGATPAAQESESAGKEAQTSQEESSETNVEEKSEEKNE